jgi:hypothetical protein
MLMRLIHAIAVGFIAGLICLFLAAILPAIHVPVITQIGSFLGDLGVADRHRRGPARLRLGRVRAEVRRLCVTEPGLPHPPSRPSPTQASEESTPLWFFVFLFGVCVGLPMAALIATMVSR